MTDEEAQLFLSHLKEWIEEEWLRSKVKEQEGSYLARYYAGGAENLAVHVMSKQEKDRVKQHENDRRMEELLESVAHRHNGS